MSTERTAEQFMELIQRYMSLRPKLIHPENVVQFKEKIRSFRGSGYSADDHEFVFRILMLLSENADPLTMSELSTQLNVPTSTATRIVDGLVKGEMVERVNNGLSPARSALSNVNYVYNITRNGQQVINGTKGALGLGDSMVQVKYELVRETSVMPALSFRTAIKLPTGDQGEYFGSGSTDFGLGLALEKALGSRWVMYGNLNGVAPTGQEVTSFALYPTIMGMAAAQYLWSENFSLTMQFDYYTTPFRNVGLEVFDKGISSWSPASATALLNIGSGRPMQLRILTS